MLDEGELNQFGEIVDLDFFRNITSKDFGTSSSKFSGLSYRSTDVDSKNYGLSEFGFIQLMQTMTDAQLSQILEKMGYDEHLYSTKSKVFVLSIHAERRIQAYIKDNV